MKTLSKRNASPEPSVSRSDRDWAMIALGVLLTLIFLVGGYVSLDQTQTTPHPHKRGPVKYPKASSLIEEGCARESENPLRRAYRFVSTPFPDGVLEQGRDIISQCGTSW